MPLVEVDQLSHQYPGKLALANVCFNIERGSFHALLGPNGAGKSTLFALISRLFRVQQGDIRVNGHSLKQAPAALLGEIGMVFQQSTLDMDLSVQQNLDYHACLHGMAGKLRKQRIEAELQRVEMLDARNQKVRALNGGHRRRVEIARALVHQPSLLLLDEATVGLDPQTRASLNQHVRSLCDQQGVTVLWSTHLIEEIQPQDPVTLLHQGQVRANACAAEICRQNAVESLVEAFTLLTSPAQKQAAQPSESGINA
ncbi:ABC transporter ATP-binding protein [Oceanobacter mangrovi]|uniref:ABC transporter ATP-binding protein n=1 Tax=Oceanobacter mangrovi TaxID=2862510 RepID=UPI001C8DBD11|nr:ABC transporter ATP-binding protein [Oceanobacter mangrovi]